jgi:hypothetical protein
MVLLSQCFGVPLIISKYLVPYTLSLNDKSSSLPRRLHFDCNNLFLQLVVPT